jgi:hypothetical protein
LLLRCGCQFPWWFTGRREAQSREPDNEDKNFLAECNFLTTFGGNRLEQVLSLANLTTK